MFDLETIWLVGGPADGQSVIWDGGNYYEVTETREVGKLRPSASAAFRSAATKVIRHVYVRSDDDRSLFVYREDA